MPFVKDWINFVYEESLFSEDIRLKPKPRGNSSPLAEASGNMENRRNKGRSRDKRPHGCGHKMPIQIEASLAYTHFLNLRLSA